jgi:hypothetical protein
MRQSCSRSTGARPECAAARIGIDRECMEYCNGAGSDLVLAGERSAGSGGRTRRLIANAADDNAGSIDALARFFECYGLDVQIARDGTQARRFSVDRHPTPDFSISICPESAAMKWPAISAAPGPAKLMQCLSPRQAGPLPWKPRRRCSTRASIVKFPYRGSRSVIGACQAVARPPVSELG